VNSAHPRTRRAITVAPSWELWIKRGKWGMKRYVVGLLFSWDRNYVVLIRKKRPFWQSGKLNGPGGHVEDFEFSKDAMIREFKEETGLKVEGWERVVILNGVSYQVEFFRAFGDIQKVKTTTDEEVQIHSAKYLPPNIVTGLSWIIPLALDDKILMPMTVNER
jgi:8-oxo-dGTP pyrophosphatase MutT (NUDIX family)